MTQPFRTPSGGRIYRGRPLAFSFDGKRLTGCHGDTLASALLANGVHLVGRSFKYHRPRGIVSAGAEEPNALVTLDRGVGRITPNLRATQLELHEGMRVHSQNRFPSLGFDLGAVNNVIAPLLSAGFYYKTFMWPRIFWRHLYEPAIRAAAGLGRAPTGPDPDRYLHQYVHCDVLVIGAGPAGIAAALSASARKVRVVVCDEQFEMGGALLADTRSRIEGKSASVWLAESLQALEDAGVMLLPRTTAFGWYANNMIGAVERVTEHLADPDPRLLRERTWHIRAREVVVATGALERPLVFSGNDRPGVMLAGSALTYLLRYGVRVGSQVVVAAADDSAYASASELQQAGVGIAALVDWRQEASDTARNSNLPVRIGTTVTATSGRLRVDRAVFSNGEKISCDALLMCGGWMPTVHLFAQSREKLHFDDARQAFLPGAWNDRVRCAGACNGTDDLAACLQEGYDAGSGVRQVMTPASRSVFRGVLPATAGATAFVDFQHDVTVKDLRTATQEGFRSIEHVKRYTTAGMATDQGKLTNLNALTIVADLLDQPIPQVGHTTFRAPYTPVTFGALAGSARGKLFEPVRRTPMHDQAVALGAVFENVGAWQRARHFPREGEDMHGAVARECRTVRTAAGMFDATTLGKIEVTGPDAAEFLDRIYTGRMSRLVPGSCRYGLLLTEAGYVLDDGVVARLAADRFHVTTTTGGAAGVLHHMEDYRQTEFPELRVWLTPVTEQWAVIAVQGPKAREVIAPHVRDIDLAPGAMPHLTVREGRICGVLTRLFRVSFTGELGYEVNVPADYGASVWQVLQAGKVAPYGTEAMHVLRAEKGYIIIGQETDGTVIPSDLGLDWAIAGAKRDFVGKRSLARPDMLRSDRRQLVGLLSGESLEVGAQVVADGVAIGHITSAYWSDTLQSPFALGLIAAGRSRIRQIVHVPLQHHTVAVRVTGAEFYDRQGSRLHG